MRNLVLGLLAIKALTSGWTALMQRARQLLDEVTDIDR